MIKVPQTFTNKCEECKSCETEKEKYLHIQICNMTNIAYEEGYKKAIKNKQLILNKREISLILDELDNLEQRSSDEICDLIEKIKSKLYKCL